MLNHLFATILICLGVANTTPISNYDQEKSNLVLTTPKKENYTENYTLPLEIYTYQSTTFADKFVYVDGFSTGNGHTATGRIRATNDALTIVGTYYKDYTSVNTGTYAELFEHINFYDVSYASKENREEIGIMLKITPYNINRDTELNLSLSIEIAKYNQNENYFQLRMKREIYTATENSWNQYIDQQATYGQALHIEEDIKDINNGFYYQQQSDTYNLTNIQFDGNASMNATWNNDLTITLTPRADNYIYITYTPLIWSDAQYPQSVTQGTIRPNGANWDITGTMIAITDRYEVVDIPGLMFEVIGMPFAFVSQAFNLTLFPGTPYQINISNLFLSIFAIIIFVWLLLLFIKMKLG